MTLLEMSHWGLAWKLQKPLPFPVSSLCLMIVSQDVSSRVLMQSLVCLPAAILLAVMVTDSNPLEL